MQPVQTNDPVRVIVADDHELVRSGIKALLSMVKGVEVIAEARDGLELIQLTESLNPDIVLTDISMPHLDGISAIVHLHVSRPKVRLVVLSMYDSADFIKRAVASGACGYLLKDTPPAELGVAIERIMAYGDYFSPAISSRLLATSEPSAKEQLTERQVEILTLLAQGLSSKEIGYKLDLSSKTVDVHRARIMERLHINDLASLTRYAIRSGLIDA